MASAAQKRAVSAYRERLAGRGVSRFEVLGADADRELIRSLARRLPEGGPEAEEICNAVHRAIEPGGEGNGGILAALRRSPLVGAEIVFERPRVAGRKVHL